MATAAPIPGSTAQSHNHNISWWTGEQVRDHLGHCRDPDAALLKLGHDVAAGRAEAKVSSASDPRNGGRPQVYPEPPQITADLWWRIMDLVPTVDVWAAPILSLPRTGNEKAVDLVGLRFRESDVRRVAEEHGFQPLAGLKPKSRGGVSCRLHGVVVAEVTMALLQRNREHVLGLTGANLKADVQKRYKKLDPRGLSDQNAGRVANGIVSPEGLSSRQPTRCTSSTSISSNDHSTTSAAPDRLILLAFTFLPRCLFVCSEPLVNALSPTGSSVWRCHRPPAAAQLRRQSFPAVAFS